MRIRKIVTIAEVINGEGRGEAVRPVTRVAGAGIIYNPHAGRFVDDVSDLFSVGYELGVMLMKHMLPLLPAPAESYGKAAIVGVNGDLEHGHALLHPKLGKAMRDPIGGGQSLIPSSARVGPAGATVDIPLGHKDDQWSFDHFDAMTICVPDSPRPDEILMAIAIADGGRPIPRVGKARTAT
ncbi:MAG: amino acid synthesis family protein [Actinobacteria bacterium]|nr:MAG: amino acid synthesis family protein [Actinomycetota bacterium]